MPTLPYYLTLSVRIRSYSTWARWAAGLLGCWALRHAKPSRCRAPKIWGSFWVRLQWMNNCARTRKLRGLLLLSSSDASNRVRPLTASSFKLHQPNLSQLGAQNLFNNTDRESTGRFSTKAPLDLFFKMSAAGYVHFLYFLLSLPFFLATTSSASASGASCMIRGDPFPSGKPLGHTNLYMLGIASGDV